MIKQFFIFISPLICSHDRKLSIARFWITLLLAFALGDFWFFGKDIPNMMFQIIMVLLSYELGKKAVVTGKNVFTSYAAVKWKSTERVEQYKVDASKAAKADIEDC